MAKRYYPVDANLLFCEDKTLAASDIIADATPADVIYKIGAGQQEFDWVVDVTAIEIADNNEKYTFLLQGSDSATFASGIVNLAELTLGATEILLGGAGDSVIGRYAQSANNEVGGVEYDYVRLNLIIAGTIATGITFSSWLTERT